MQLELLNDQGQSTAKVDAPDTVFARDYNEALVQVNRVFNGNSADCDSAEHHGYHNNHGYPHAVIILDLLPAPRFELSLDYLGKN